jgi:hypothetical protein
MADNDFVLFQPDGYQVACLSVNHPAGLLFIV